MNSTESKEIKNIHTRSRHITTRSLINMIRKLQSISFGHVSGREKLGNLLAAEIIKRKRSKVKQQEKMDRVRKELGLERVTDALKGGGGEALT